MKTCCHICKEQQFHYRNEEQTIRHFYIRHIPCIKRDQKAVETIIDQIQEPDWIDIYEEFITR